MTIYEELVQKVSDGENFCINFEKRNMKVGKQLLIKSGEWSAERVLIDVPTHSVMQIIEDLYQAYKYSLPSERSDGKYKKYFKALHANELTDVQMMVGERREIAQAKLEGLILCMILNGSLQWDEPTMGKWFWQSKNDPDFVILRSWVENKNN